MLHRIGRRYLSALDFDRWVRNAKAGDALCYFRGDLAASRTGPGREARSTDALAKTAILYTGEELPVVSKCYHVRGVTRGPAVVRLVQERDPSGLRRYVAIRR